MLNAINSAKRTTAPETTKVPEIPTPVSEPPPSPGGPVSSPPVQDGRVTRRKMTRLRQRIAQRLVASQKEAAILSTFNEADMQAVKDLRAHYQDAFTKRYGIKLGFMSFFIKAVVHALKEVPAVNSRIDGDTIIENHFYDIGVAVSTEKGLLVPVIRNCDELSLAEIESELITYSNKAREGKITIQDLEGGVFTVSNGGVFGSLLSTPIINPPQAGILGMHAIQDRPVARAGQVVIRPMMYLALSYDHRLIDGRQAVTFLVKVKEAIEDPARLVIGI
jgi:2-oxoglutarate dehydrogenase E2 component (dihydrolipoamide succinyltransferase)